MYPPQGTSGWGIQLFPPTNRGDPKHHHDVGVVGQSKMHQSNHTSKSTRMGIFLVSSVFVVFSKSGAHVLRKHTLSVPGLIVWGNYLIIEVAGILRHIGEHPEH